MTRSPPLKGLLLPSAGPLLRGRLHAEDGRHTSGMVLLDTGASMSVVDREVARDLGLPSVRAAEWRAVGSETMHHAPLRQVQVQLGDRRLWKMELIEADILRTVPGYTLIALLGWDFLDRCKLTVDGPGGTFALELPREKSTRE